uniref:SGNH hydrolase-type esterase domain-containing protein n=1 Tax=Kryptolebias marmoratus TaxID=37003 RepID=A0A3Q2ZWK5_KRYMA
MMETSPSHINTRMKVLCSPNDTVSDITEKILPLPTDQLNLIIHIGANDLAKQKSEILKNDFHYLLRTIKNLKMKVFISGPIPTAGRGDENYSRLNWFRSFSPHMFCQPQWWFRHKARHIVTYLKCSNRWDKQP